jgi:hypothetical protein
MCTVIASPAERDEAIYAVWLNVANV